MEEKENFTFKDLEEVCKFEICKETIVLFKEKFKDLEDFKNLL